MRTGRKGLAIIKEFEGWRSVAYLDPVGIWTIGYGHTAMAGEPKPSKGMRITKEEGEAILKRDLVKYENAVKRYIKVDVAQEQFDAMVSLCYNIGPGNFAKSSVVKAVNRRQWDDAARRFHLWNKAGGRVLPGLVRRRAAEAALFAEAQPEHEIVAAMSEEIDVPHGKSMASSKTFISGATQVATGAALVTGTVAETKGNLETIAGAVNWPIVILIGVGAALAVFGLWAAYDRWRKSKEDGV